MSCRYHCITHCYSFRIQKLSEIRTGRLSKLCIPSVYCKFATKLSLVNGWPTGYAFILSFLAPLWTICRYLSIAISFDSYIFIGGFDSSVHISEEATNAAIAVPWAIVSAIGIAGILGTGVNFNTSLLVLLITSSDQHLPCLLHGYRS